mgnify:CR=1 FL=1
MKTEKTTILAVTPFALLLSLTACKKGPEVNTHALTLHGSSACAIHEPLKGSGTTISCWGDHLLDTPAEQAWQASITAPTSVALQHDVTCVVHQPTGQGTLSCISENTSNFRLPPITLMSSNYDVKEVVLSDSGNRHFGCIVADTGGYDEILCWTEQHRSKELIRISSGSRFSTVINPRKISASKKGLCYETDLGNDCVGIHMLISVFKPVPVANLPASNETLLGLQSAGFSASPGTEATRAYCYSDLDDNFYCYQSFNTDPISNTPKKPVAFYDVYPHSDSKFIGCAMTLDDAIHCFGDEDLVKGISTTSLEAFTTHATELHVSRNLTHYSLCLLASKSDSGRVGVACDDNVDSASALENIPSELSLR